MTTSYMETPTGDRLAALVLAIIGPGVAPRIVEMPREQCDWCAEVDAWTTVRVYGQPRPDVLHPIEQVEVCGLCAPTVIDRAKSEARDDAGDIVIEVAA